jgi:hypothetical protein
MSNTVLAGLVYQICELYIDDVLIHVRDIESVLANIRNVFAQDGSQESDVPERHTDWEGPTMET